MARLAGNAHRFELEGDTLRKKKYAKFEILNQSLLGLYSILRNCMYNLPEIFILL